MITLKSSKASKPVEVRCEDNLREQGQWLADTIAEFEARGRALDDGVAVQVGWTTFVLRQQPEGSLRVCEPDYAADPFKTLRPEVTTSLTVLVAQMDLVRAMLTEPMPCRFDQKLVVRKGALDEARIFANRQPPNGDDSGWYIGPAHDGRPAPPPKAEDLESMRLYQLLQRRPAILYAMALPPGYTVVWNGHTIEALADPQGQNQWHPPR
jgi:hypothetical protein